MLVVALIVVFCLGLKLLTVDLPHKENDEVIYWQLAQNMIQTGRYSLQGTEILKILPPGMYDHSLFRHPPLYPALLVPFVLADSMRWAVTISWLGHALSLLAVAVMGRRLLASFNGKESVSPYAPVFWVPLLGMTFDPITTFASRKLWMDSLMGGLLAMALAVFYVSHTSKRSRWLLVAGGVLLGLAALVKTHALLAAPVAVLILVHHYRPWRQRGMALLLGGLPVLLLAGPWLAVFYAHFGTLLPWQVRPDAQAVARFPFLKWIVQRPATVYLSKLMLIEPLVPLAFVACLFLLLKHRRFELGMLLSWFGLFFVALTYIGKAGIGFLLRYLCPLLPSAYLMVYCWIGLSAKHRPVLLLVSVLCILFAAMGVGIGLLYPPANAEILSIFEMVGVLRPM